MEGVAAADFDDAELGPLDAVLERGCDMLLDAFYEPPEGEDEDGGGGGGGGEGSDSDEHERSWRDDFN